MEISKTFQAEIAETKWYSYWMQQGYFRSVPDEREPYTIVIPPPNVTGVLHMGHMLNNTLQDVMIRRARMLAKMPVGFQVQITPLSLPKQRWYKCLGKKASKNRTSAVKNF